MIQGFSSSLKFIDEEKWSLMVPTQGGVVAPLPAAPARVGSSSSNRKSYMMIFEIQIDFLPEILITSSSESLLPLW